MLQPAGCPCCYARMHCHCATHSCTGVLDGGRIAHALWGRRAAGRIGVITLALLGVTGVFDTLALFWVLFVVTLQRGPIAPQREELSAPQGEGPDQAVGISLLVMCLLVLLPYPGSVLPDLGF